MHGTGMWLGAFLPLLLGGTAITSKNLGFDADQLWTQVEDTKTTNIVIVGEKSKLLQITVLLPLQSLQCKSRISLTLTRLPRNISRIGLLFICPPLFYHKTTF